MPRKAPSIYRNCLRFLFRRESCYWVNGCEICVTLALLIYLSAIIALYVMAKQKSSIFDQEDAMYKTMKNQISFAHCNYNHDIDNSTSNPFKTEFCSNRPMKNAMAWRYMKSTTTDNETCLDVLDQVDCHEDLIKTWLSKLSIQLPTKLSACYGLFEYRFNEINDTPSDVDVKQPQIFHLTPFLHETLHSSEVFVQCPKCSKNGEKAMKFKENEPCYNKLKTTTKGWPAFAEECDDLIKSDPTKPCDLQTT